MKAYLAALAARDFRLLWVGATASTLGDAMTVVVLTWLVYTRAGSGGVAWLVFAYGAPVVAGGLAAGGLLARFGPVRCLLADSLVRAAVVASVPAAAALGTVPLFLPYVVAASYGLAKMVPLTGVPTLVPDLVPPKDRNAANALETVSYGAGAVLGPALAGILLAVVPAATILVGDAVSFCVFAACLASMGRRDEPARDGGGPAGGAGLAAAARLIAASPVLRATTAMFTAFNVGAGALAVLMPVYAVRVVLHGGARQFGLLSAALAFGELVGAAGAGALAPSLGRLGRAVAAAQTAAGLAVVGMLARPGLAAASGLLFALGAFSAPMTVWAQTLRMAVVPGPLRGHVFALLRTSMQSGPPLGGVAGGAAVAAGVVPALALVAVLTGGPGVAGLAVPALAGDPAR